MKKIIALSLAGAMAVGLAACGSTSSAVGTVGDLEVSGGLYLLSQLNAMQLAFDLAPEGTETAKDLLNAQLTLEDGSSVAGSQHVANETLSRLYYMAAVEQQFAEQGLALTEQMQAQVQTQVDQMWAYYESLYTENGIGYNTLYHSTEIDAKASVLFESLYEEAVTDSECEAWLAENTLSGNILSLPLANTQDYSAEVTDEAIASVKEMAQKAADALNSGETMETVVNNWLPQAYEAIGMEYSEDERSRSYGPTLMMPSDLAYYETAEGGNAVADVVSPLAEGKAAVVEMGNALWVFQRQKATALVPLDTIKTGYGLLYEMKYDEFTDEMVEIGTALPQSLDSKVMSSYAASKAKL